MAESIPVTVAAGTTEVQKNIIAQRGLGLPGAPGTMDLTLDDDQRLLADSARQLFERTYTTESAREAEERPDGFSRRALGAGGRARLARHRAARGLRRRRLRPLELAILAEELGRGAATLPLLSSYAATLPLLWSGSESRRARWLGPATGGDAVAALALVDPGRRDRARRPRARRHRGW